MAQIESEFGLTPSSRSRIHMAEPTETVDPFEEYLNRGKDP
jgi:phage terminase small subunit